MYSNIATKDKNIIFFEDILQENLDDENDKEIISQFVDMVSERERKKALKNVDDIAKNRIEELENKCMRQELKLHNCIPNGIIARVVIYASAVIACACIFITQLIANYKLVDYHILLALCIFFLGLLHTTISTLKDWKKFINNV